MENSPLVRSLRQLAEATDFEVLQVFEHLSLQCNAYLATIADPASLVPEEIKTLDGLDIFEHFRARGAEPLPSAIACGPVRKLLTLLSTRDEDSAEWIAQAFKNREEDKRQITDIILTLGTVGAMLIFAAGTRIRYKSRHFTFEKEPLSGDQLRGLSEVVRGLFRVKQPPKQG